MLLVGTEMNAEDLAHNVALGTSSLANSSGSSSSATQIVQLGTAHLAMAENFDALDPRAVKRECSFDANPMRSNTAYCEVLVDAATSTSNYDAFIRLDTLTSTFNDTVMHTNVIAGAKVRDVVPDEFLFEFPNCIDHDHYLPDGSMYDSKFITQQEAALCATNEV
jgi:hypothetical protein